MEQKTNIIYYELAVNGDVYKKLTTHAYIDDFVTEKFPDGAYYLAVGEHFLIMDEENDGVYPKGSRKLPRNEALVDFVKDATYTGVIYWILADENGDNLINAAHPTKLCKYKYSGEYDCLTKILSYDT
jgi:hypothetical protein